MEITLLAATTSAASAQEINLTSYKEGVISADNLAGAEEVDLFIRGKALTDKDGNVQKLTATIPALVLTGYRHYTFSKDATAGACAIHLALGPDVNS